MEREGAGDGLERVEPLEKKEAACKGDLDRATVLDDEARQKATRAAEERDAAVNGKEEYKKKVEELLELHRPFSKTPMEWQGCKGSSPQYRGYPCSLW